MSSTSREDNPSVSAPQEQGQVLQPAAFFPPNAQVSAQAFANLWAAQQAQGLPGFFGASLYGGGMPYGLPGAPQQPGADGSAAAVSAPQDAAPQNGGVAAGAAAAAASLPMTSNAMQQMMAAMASAGPNAAGANPQAAIAALAQMQQQQQQQQPSPAQQGDGVAVLQSVSAPNASEDGSGGGEPMDEREAKKLRRKQSNRESARRSRMKKQAECEGLDQRVSDLTAENARLKEENLQLQAKVDVLMAQLHGQGKPFAAAPPSQPVSVEAVPVKADTTQPVID